MKTVLILGAGRVSAPAIDYLLRKGNCRVVVSDVAPENLRRTAELFPSVETILEDAGRATAELIERCAPQAVLNLLPPEFMPDVSKICLEKGVHMVHPAYLDAPTKAIAEEVERAGLIFVVELGLDPGIDHMSAAKTIAEIHEEKGSVDTFRSLCGALPSAEANTNPWGYKLSWSPSSLIGASRRTAKVLQDGKGIVWPDGETYEHAYLYEVPKLGAFEVYANADSTVYRESYGIPEVGSIYRGTLRYPGWCETICYMNAIGFFGTDKLDTKGMTFAAFTARQAGALGSDPKEALRGRFGLKACSAFVMRMEWLGFFDGVQLPFVEASPRDVVAHLFAEKLVFAPDERDLVVLCDEIEASFPGGGKRLYRSVLIDRGVPGKWSSIAKTTGVPPAIAVRFILEGVISTPGIHPPMAREIFAPVLAELEAEGIVLKEEIVAR